MQLWKVQKNAPPWGGVREVRGGSYSIEGAPRTHGPYRVGHAGGAHLVSQEFAEPHWRTARHVAQGHRKGSLFRVVHRCRSRRDAAAVQRAVKRNALP